mmetsp:Transcript_289/g.301  ORF Transcript_289/g.301 Transcript_289/m.301 type:complete len:122 (+) Transcript_289:373-738(+)
MADVPILLVGTQKDLYDKKEFKDTASFRPVSREQIVNMKAKINAREFIEVSSLTGTGMKELLEKACKLGLESHFESLRILRSGQKNRRLEFIRSNSKKKGAKPKTRRSKSSRPRASTSSKT